MSKHIVGVSISQAVIGVAGYDKQYGQYTLPSGGAKARVLNSSSHAAAYLVEFRSYLLAVLKSRKYSGLALLETEYGIHSKGFAEAEAKARMVGVAMMTAAECSVRLSLVAPKAVSEMAIGRKGATLDDYVDAAAKNGVMLKSQRAAEAFWIMVLASKE